MRFLRHTVTLEARNEQELDQDRKQNEEENSIRVIK